MDQKPEINIVIRFCFYKLSSKELTTCLNSELKRLSLNLLICCNQNKYSKKALPLSCFLQGGLTFRQSCRSLLFAALL